MRTLAILPLLLSSCAMQYGETRYANGVVKSRYLHMDMGRDVQAHSGGPEAFAIIGQDESKSFRNAMTAGVSWKTVDVWGDVQKGEQVTDRTSITEGARTDRTSITEGAKTARLRETETTKRILEGVSP